MKRSKKERQELLKETIRTTPFITDEELAQKYQVSIQTIRLDRLELSIPEVRERIKHVAHQQFDVVKALPIEEVIGEIIDLQLDDSAISLLDIKAEHVFSRTGITRGHHLFAQANSLAIAVTNDELALTERSQIHFRRPVKEGERVIAKARVTKVQEDRSVVEVSSFVDNEQVFQGEFIIYRHSSEVKSSDNK